jgi:hypothetical protein
MERMLQVIALASNWISICVSVCFDTPTRVAQRTAQLPRRAKTLLSGLENDLPSCRIIEPWRGLVIQIRGECVCHIHEMGYSSMSGRVAAPP